MAPVLRTLRLIAVALAAMACAGAAAAQSKSDDQGADTSQGPVERTELHPLSDLDRDRLQQQNPPAPAPAKNVFVPPAPGRHDGGGSHMGGDTPFSKGINIRSAHDHGEATIVLRCGGIRWRLSVPPSVWACDPNDEACIDQMDADGEALIFPPLRSCPYGFIYNRASRKCQDLKDVVKQVGWLPPCVAAWLLDKKNAPTMEAAAAKAKQAKERPPDGGPGKDP
jgi:hypothetical protein